VRNRYRAALRTYRRPAFLGVLIAAGGWLVMLGLMIFLSRLLHQVPDAPESVQNQIREARAPQVREVQLTVVSGFIGFYSFILLSFVGTGLSIHLKAMLGAPTSPLVPGLRQTHLTLAGLMIAGVIGVLALTICCGPGLGVSPLAVVAYLLAMLAIPAFLAHWRPETLVVMVIVMPGLLMTRHGRDFIWPPSTQVTIVVLAVAIGCLVSVGMRLGRFNEEMPEYRLRIQTGVAPGATRVLWLAPLGDMRYWRGVGTRTPANLLWRARHWHAAWGTLWVAPVTGLCFGATTGFVAMFPWHLSVRELIGSPSLPYLAVVPVVGVLAQNRPFLMQELLRPQSRSEHVRAVGATLALATFLCWATTLVGALLICWILKREGPSIEEVWRPAIFSLSCVLTLFGLVTWPYRSAFVYMCYFAMCGVMGSFALVPMPLSGQGFAIASSVLALAGVFLTRRSYRRWVNEEVDWNSDVWSLLRSWRSRSAGVGLPR
jgi:hypothetical protein